MRVKLVKSICFAILIFCGTALSAQTVDVNQKFSEKFREKIEKVIVGQVLSEIKKTDYDTYRVVSALWKGIKNQSLITVYDNLKQLLVEKGFTYLLYFNTKTYSYPTLSLFLLSDHYLELMKKHNPYVFQFIHGYYGVYAREILLEYKEYFDPENLYYFYTEAIGQIADLLDEVDVFNEDDDATIDDIINRFFTYLLNDSDLQIKRGIDLQQPKAKRIFLEKLRNLVLVVRKILVDLEQEPENWEEGDFGIDWLYEDYLNDQVFDTWIKEEPAISYEDMDKIYLELISYFIRMAITQNKGAKYQPEIGNFIHLAATLNQRYPSFPKNLITLDELEFHSARMLDVYQNNPIAQIHWGFVNLLLINLEVNGDRIVDEYKAQGFFSGLMTRENITDYFLDFLAQSLEFLVEDYSSYLDSPPEYVIDMIQLVAIVADYIQDDDLDQLTQSIKNYAYKKIDMVLMELQNGAIDKIDQILIDADYKLNQIDDLNSFMDLLDMVLFTDFIRYYFGAVNYSELMDLIAYYVETKTNSSLHDKDFIDKMEKSFGADDSILTYSPVFQYIVSKVIVAYKEAARGEGDILGLINETRELLPLIGKEIVAIADLIPDVEIGDKSYNINKDILGMKIPIIGTRASVIFRLIGEADQDNFKKIVSETFRQTVSLNINKLEPQIRDIISPFVELGISALIYKKEISLEEFTNVAMDILNTLNRELRSFYLAVGFSFAQFGDSNIANLFSGNDETSAARLYIADKIGIDLVGIVSDLSQTPVMPLRGGIYVGGFLDFLLTEIGGLETQNQPGGRNFIKVGAFLGYDDLSNDLLKFDVAAGAAFTFSWQPSWFVSLSWNALDLMDLF